MRAGYFLRDSGEATKAFVFPAVAGFLDDHLVGYAMPFPDQACTGQVSWRLIAGAFMRKLDETSSQFFRVLAGFLNLNNPGEIVDQKPTTSVFR